MGALTFFVVVGGVVGCVACTLGGSWVYYRRYQLARAPIGVINLQDIVVVMVAIIVVPFLYLLLPVWLGAALLLLTALSVLHATLQPVLRTRWAIRLAAAALLLVDGAAVSLPGIPRTGSFAVNNLVLLVLVVGIANLWAQSGVKARDMVVLGLFLAIYDFIATVQLPLMTALLDRFSGLPLAPMLVWGSGNTTLGLGLGDLLMASVFPLAMRKGYGRLAGGVALALAWAAITLLCLLPLRQVFPVMVVLGPVMAVQYLFWRSRRGLERTTREYLLAEPLSARGGQIAAPKEALRSTLG